jgi:hypothetical protein
MSQCNVAPKSWSRNPASYKYHESRVSNAALYLELDSSLRMPKQELEPRFNYLSVRAQSAAAMGTKLGLQGNCTSRPLEQEDKRIFVRSGLEREQRLKKRRLHYLLRKKHPLGDL